MHYKMANKKQSEQTAMPAKYPQGYFKEKACRKCKTLFTPQAPSHHYCSDTCKDYALTDHYLKRTYNITLETYNTMLDAQDSKCSLCGGEGFIMARHHKNKLVVDHCHATGVVRGLLCHNCNRALGLFKDNSETLAKAIDYLEGATTIRKE